MRNIIIGWVLGTFRLGGFPALYNLVAAEVEQVFEDNNIISRKDKLNWLAGDKLPDMVREYHNKNISAAFKL